MTTPLPLILTGIYEHSEQQCNELERLANGDVMTFATQEFHSPSPAVRRKIETSAASLDQDAQKYDDAMVDDLRAKINAFGEDIERFHKRVHEVR